MVDETGWLLRALYVLLGVLGSWIGKKLLDATVGPRFDDLWARRNRRSALKQAKRLRRNLLQIVQEVGDVRQLVVRAEHRISAIVAGTAAMNGVLILVAVTVIVAPHSIPSVRNLLLFNLAMMFLLYGASVTAESHRRREAAILADFPAFWQKEKKRISKVLNAAGMTENERDAFFRVLYDESTKLLTTVR